MGKSRYVVHTALTFGLTTVGMSDVLNHVFGGGARSDSLLLHVYLEHRYWNDYGLPHVESLGSEV
jgi:hypothetical protein